MLVDDQIEEKAPSGALDELSRRINSKHSKNVAAGINVLETFQEEFKATLARNTHDMEER